MNYLKDFKELSFKTPEAFLSFEINKEKTKVSSRYKVQKLNEDSDVLFFHGEQLDLRSVKVNGETLKASDYELTEKGLKILTYPKTDVFFEVEFENFIEPAKNKDLEGLYVSGNILCTQNEPMGFRRITYSMDRPDNMVSVTTKISGDKSLFPFMLSNGNLIEETETSCTWEDPFPKPLYLFALVAGDLAEVVDSYTTVSGRKVDIKFYCDHGAEKKCDFAIQALKDSMKWDEERFGLEYDLDLYMVVAVDSFNMGAMENKGLNIFNSALVLADPKSATDENYHRIESVIGHEYFHNWTGNRVTLKNWFQLTLKEGLTVFRDQEFSADLNDRAVERIDMVKSLKERQFSEDAGPLAHPIRPEQYKEMNNFYTSTVYEKGAEIIRIYHSLLGEEKFQKGMKKYFELYDGKAITTEDFLNVMCQQDSRIKKEKMERWYHTPGTPHIKIEETFEEGNLKISFSQFNEVSKRKELGFTETYVPVKLSIYSPEGKKLQLKSNSKTQDFLSEGLVVLESAEETVEFLNVPEGSQVSYFEGFSAPVTFEIESESRDIGKLVKIEQDHFNKYQAFQDSVKDYIQGKDWGHLESFKSLLKEESMTSLMKSYILTPPSFNELVEGKTNYDPLSVLKDLKAYKEKVGNELGALILEHLNAQSLKPYQYNLKDKGDRALRRVLLDYLSSSSEFKTEASKILQDDFSSADNMTTAFDSLHLSESSNLQQADQMSESFYEEHKKEQLTLQKWIVSYISTPDFEEAHSRIKKVMSLEGFDKEIPNFLRALWGGFYRNPAAFHEPTGKGYELLLNEILNVDKINPQMSSGLMKVFEMSSRLEGPCAVAMKEKLTSFSEAQESFSSNLRETFDSIYGVLN